MPLADVTVLLSLTVFMNLVSAIMPTTSDAVPLIGKQKSTIQTNSTKSTILSEQFFWSLSFNYYKIQWNFHLRRLDFASPLFSILFLLSDFCVWKKAKICAWVQKILNILTTKKSILHIISQYFHTYHTCAVVGRRYFHFQKAFSLAYLQHGVLQIQPNVCPVCPLFYT